MISGAVKPMLGAELAAYLLLAIVVVVLAVVAPGFVDVPNWALLAFVLVAQIFLYRRFYGRF